MKSRLSSILLVFIISAVFANANAIASNTDLDFTLHKIESGKPGPTILVIGGIQGDEPGGFNAASLLVTDYDIHSGSVWVVPNLNFISIINRSRGIYGDMNRKFAILENNDPEFNAINKIKEIILHSQVDVVLNLHDGSGFYRHEYVDHTHNPRRWGQSIIIDQEHIKTERFGNLNEIAKKVAAEVNLNLYKNEHSFHVKNTRTCKSNPEMAKTLTYFAICQKKPAFGLETSKSFPTNKRAYYHLRMLEAFMNHVGIEYTKNFNLSSSEVKQAISSNIKFALYNNRIFLDVANARKKLRYIPFKINSNIEFTSSNPLLAIVDSGKTYRVFHGNRKLTRLYPEYFEYDFGIDAITMQIDGIEKNVDFGEIVDVNNSFLVVPKRNYRVNIIGFKKDGIINESGINICVSDIYKRFSVDKTGHIYRVEVYRENKFSGMVLVSFDTKSKNLRASTPWKLSMANPVLLPAIQR